MAFTIDGDQKNRLDRYSSTSGLAEVPSQRLPAGHCALQVPLDMGTMQHSLLDALFAAVALKSPTDPVPQVTEIQILGRNIHILVLSHL